MSTETITFNQAAFQRLQQLRLLEKDSQHAPCVMDQCVTLTHDRDVAWLTGVDAGHCHPKSPLRLTAEAGRIRIEQA